MLELADRTVVVAGGTGNVGTFVVEALLARGATVAVPSRSGEKLEGLRDHLRPRTGEDALRRLHTFVGHLGDEADMGDLQSRIAEEVGPPDGVVASLGALVTTSSLLETRRADLQRALDGNLFAHFMAARAFLPAVVDAGGSYVFVQGPLAFEPWEGSNADLVSISSAGQNMLFRALAQELDGGPARVVELVNHAYIRERETQPESPLPGEAVGAFAAHLLFGAAGEEVHGESIHLRSPEQLEELGLDATIG